MKRLLINCRANFKKTLFISTFFSLSACSAFDLDTADAPPVLISADTQIRDLNSPPPPRKPAPPKPVVKKIPKKPIKPAPLALKAVDKNIKTDEKTQHAAMKSDGFKNCPENSLRNIKSVGAAYAYYVKNGACRSADHSFPSVLAENWNKQAIRLLNGDPGFSAFIIASVRDSADQTGKIALSRVIDDRGCGLVKDVYCKVIAKVVKNP